MKKTFISLMLATCSMFVNAQSGSLDQSFKGNGIITGNYTSGNNSADAMVIQPDGKIIVAGATGYSSGINTGLSRFNTDGSIDTTFGIDGKMNFSSNWIKSYIYDMHLQSDGKIVVGGYRYNNTEGDFLLARINVDGTMDTSFGTNGVATFDNGGSEVAESFEIMQDGNFIISGYTDDNFTMAKVKSNGSIDQTFGQNGWLIAEFVDLPTYSKSTSINAAGRIVLAGFGMDGYTNKAVFAVMAFNPDGTMDSSFGEDGKVSFHVGYDNDFGLRVLQLEDGKILIGGHSYFDKWPLRYEIAVTKLNADGTFDMSYGTEGIFKTRFLEDGENYLQDMALQEDGKLVITGTANEDGANDFGVTRVTANGQLDETFGESGKVITKIDDNYGVSYNIALQSDGKIVVSGDAVPFDGGNAQFFIARYLNPTLAVQDVKNATVALYPNPASDQITLDWKGSTKEYQAEIYNMVGQKVMTSKVLNKSSINVSSLVKGSYFVKLNGDGKSTTLQFIKK